MSERLTTKGERVLCPNCIGRGCGVCGGSGLDDAGQISQGGPEGDDVKRLRAAVRSALVGHTRADYWPSSDGPGYTMPCGVWQHDDCTCGLDKALRDALGESSKV